MTSEIDVVKTKLSHGKEKNTKPVGGSLQIYIISFQIKKKLYGLQKLVFSG